MNWLRKWIDKKFGLPDLHEVNPDIPCFYCNNRTFVEVNSGFICNKTGEVLPVIALMVKTCNKAKPNKNWLKGGKNG